MDNYNKIFIDCDVPPPLSKEEFIYYYEQMKSGDSSAREKLIVHNIRLVLNVIQTNFSRNGYEKEDLTAYGLIGLIKSVDYFDLSKKVEFSSFAAKVIKNEIVMYMRREKKHVNNISIESSISSKDKLQEITILDSLRDEKVNIEEDFEWRTALENYSYLINTLPEREQEVIKLYFGFYDDKHYTQQEISEIINISRSYISRIISNSLKQMKEQMYMDEIHQQIKNLINSNLSKQSELVASEKVKNSKCLTNSIFDNKK